MMRSLYAGVSGLRAHQSRMDVIGNNISNINTVGFKKGRVTFRDMLSQMIQAPQMPRTNRGGINPKQIGMGVDIGSIDNNFSQGSMQYTGMVTDMAINGNGFFILDDGQRNVYTRAGNLTLDSQGNLVHGHNGYRLQGWSIGEDGRVNTTRPVSDMHIPIGDRISPEATRNVRFDGNLQAETEVYFNEIFSGLEVGSLRDGVTLSLQQNDDPPAVELVGSDISGYRIVLSGDVDGLTAQEIRDLLMEAETSPPIGDVINVKVLDADAQLDLADGDSLDTALDDPLGIPYYESTVDVFDGYGSRHEVTVRFERTGQLDNDINTWTWQISGPTVEVNGLPSGTISFDSVTGAVIDGGIGDISLNPVNGSEDFDVAIDMTKLTQFTGDYTVKATDSDGYEMGYLQSFTVDELGMIQGIYTNGLNRSLGQVALANFNNEGGLIKESDTMFSESANSGIPQVGIPGAAGSGEIQVSTLEMSNVDLAQEFADMIITQRGYQSNSRSVSTVDEMLQELLNMKR